MQAIVTKYIGPSNVKGSRVKAICQAGSITLHWDHALNQDQNHCEAAKALAKKLDWINYGDWHCGWLPDQSCVWVCANPKYTTRNGYDVFTV